MIVFLISDETCGAPIIGERTIAGSDWSDESCALVHGPPTGIRIWHIPPENFIKLWVRFNSFHLPKQDDVICCVSIYNVIFTFWFSEPVSF